jgi:TPR repeat protein
MGFLHQEGRGVSENTNEALTWYRLAAAQGNGKAQYMMGKIYAEGLGVEPDMAIAAEWYRQAAEQILS